MFASAPSAATVTALPVARVSLASMTALEPASAPAGRTSKRYWPGGTDRYFDTVLYKTPDSVLAPLTWTSTQATSHEVSSNAGRRIAAIHPLSCEPRGRPEAMRAPRPGGAAAGSDGAATARAVRGARPRLLRRLVPERDCRAARRAAAHSQGPYLRGLRRLPALWRRTITADSGPSALVRRPAGADVAPMESLVLLPVAPAVGLRPPVLLRLATFADVDAVAAMHRRCSAATASTSAKVASRRRTGGRSPTAGATGNRTRDSMGATSAPAGRRTRAEGPESAVIVLRHSAGSRRRPRRYGP